MVNVTAPLLALMPAAPTPTPSVPPSSSTSGPFAVATLTWGQVQSVLTWSAALMIAIGVVVAWNRKNGGSSPDDGTSIVRAWIALILVSSLVLLCLLAFAINDLTLRNTLIGGLIASVSGVSAFYFSSKGSDEARQDLLSAMFGIETVPKVTDLTRDLAITTLGSTSFALTVDSAHPPANDDAPIQDQNPKPGGKAMRGTEIVVTF